MKDFKKKDIDALNYIISERADEIDQLKLAEVGNWIAQEAVYDRSAPTFKYFCGMLVTDLVDLILEDYGPSVLLEKFDEKELFYVNEFNNPCSVFQYTTFKDVVNIPQKLLKPRAFNNTTFDWEVHINATDIPEDTFRKSIFKEDVTISDGCKSLDEGCFQSDFIDGAKLYIPKTVESIHARAFAEDYHTKNSIHFGGTVEQFNKLTIKADNSISKNIIDTNTWPDYVVCSNGTWTKDDYQK